MACKLKQVPLCLKTFVAHVLDLVCESFLGTVLCFYILIGKPFASSFIIIALRDCLTN